MAAPKAKTRMQQMGFLDDDLASPSHDNLIARFLSEGMNNINHLLPQRNDGEWRIKNTSIEVPVMDRKYIIGFVDVVLDVDFYPVESISKLNGVEIPTQDWKDDAAYEKALQLLHQNGCDHADIETLKFDNEKGFAVRNTPFLYVLREEYKCLKFDLRMPPEFCPRRIAIEFKVTVPSMGELLRQMNTYRTYKAGDMYVVVMADTLPYTELVQQQGFHVIEMT